MELDLTRATFTQIGAAAWLRDLDSAENRTLPEGHASMRARRHAPKVIRRSGARRTSMSTKPESVVESSSLAKRR